MSQIPANILLCPVCRDQLKTGASTQHKASLAWEGRPRLLQCAQGHRFDAARQGYFNLLTGRGTGFEADTAAMVQARINFLGSGHFTPLAEAIAASAAEFSVDNPVVLDAGAGTGYYVQKLEQQLPVSAVVALDISKYALRRAAKALPDAVCLVWDVWRPLPIVDESVDLLVNIFAPRNPLEFARVSRNGGVLIVVTPLPHHLQEISKEAGLLDIRPGKDDDVAAALVPSFEPVASRVVQFSMILTPTDVRNIAAMGPAGHHGATVRESTLPERATVTAAFTVQSFRRRARNSANEASRR